MKTINKRKLPPGPTSMIPFGNVFGFRKNSLEFLKKASAEYGDIVHFKMGPLRIVLLNHPTYIREILTSQSANFVKGRPLELAKEILGEGLLTSEGELHKQQSRIIQPAFHLRMMEAYAPAMTEYSDRLMASWEDGQEVDMLQEMIRMSTAIAGKTMFNIDIEKDAPEINLALDDIMSLFGRITMPFAEVLLKLPLPSTKKFYNAKERLDKTIYGIIDERRKDPLENGDLLSLLLKAQLDEKGTGMSNVQIRDEALTLLLTAFDTTSLALTWTWYLLSQNPEFEEHLYKEIDEVLQGRTPTIEDYSKLPYTKKIFEESMRIYPPIYIIARESINEFSIGDYVVPGGAIILASPYLIHHDPRFHPNPEKFDPEGFAQRLESSNSKYEYFPFSVGPRSCIGQHYAMLEGVLVLAAIAQKWKLRTIPGQKVQMEQLLNLRPKNGLQMTVHKR
jgi:cytochrome P450